MNALQVEDTRLDLGFQVAVPRPAPDESSPSNINFLLDGLRAAGKVGASDRVELHASGNYHLFLCSGGHITTRPNSCNYKLCPWCRQRRLETWGMSLFNATCAVGEGYVFEALCGLNPKTIRKFLSKSGTVPGSGGIL